MVEEYRARLDEEEFFRLQRKMARRVKRERPLTEEDVEESDGSPVSLSRRTIEAAPGGTEVIA
jgi:hypothetical protein